ncbi:MAG: glycosyltransferase [Tannerella sp.]|jgi:glycosyltransferase involved in cell wall biosynthesis|nr:glycosyltransferase [Tannerella sp.]
MFSIIIPVYNRPDEVEELLESLAGQTFQDEFEIVIIEDGSTLPCADIVEKHSKKLNINYITKPNTGRSDSRNVGMKMTKGDYFIFFDSDCIIPSGYLQTVDSQLKTDYSDCFGGPDSEHPSFTVMQKAVNYAMTSFWTTGGIRGGKVNLEKFKPRTFNMGFSREVYNKVGGFNDMYGEDIDLSIRIQRAGFTVKLYRDAFVWHKRRVNIKRFYRQVNIFGQARVNLYKLYPESLKAVHALPAVCVTGLTIVIILAFAVSRLWLLLPAAYILLLFCDALLKTKSLKISALAVLTSAIQIVGYGLGFIKSFIFKILLRQGLENAETLKRKYK